MATSARKQSSTMDGAAARRMLAALFDPGDVVELRCPDHPRLKTVTAGYFDDHEQLIEAAAKHSGRCPGVYITLNPVPNSLLARAKNRTVEPSRQTTSDLDVSRRRWFFIDIDPIRPSGISANDEEHAAAQQAREQIRGWLSSQGWPMPIEADSGNGAYLLYKIDLANNDGSRDLIRSCLNALAIEFDSAHVCVDRSCFNAARIAKLIGTMARKGDEIEDRPHRLSRLLAVPDPVCLVPADLLDALARREPPKEPPAYSMGSRNGINAEEFLHRHHIEVSKVKPWQGHMLYELGKCPFNEGHARTARVIQHQSGAVSFQCFHASCQGHDWHALREMLEPGRNGHSASHLGQRGHPFPFPTNIGGNGNGSTPADPTPQPAAVPERWHIVCCSQLAKRPDEQRWIWQGCIARGGVTQFNALFKAGKTTLLAHLLRALERDGSFCGLPCKRSKVLYVTEEPDDNWVDRRDELGLKDHIHFIRNPFLTKPTKKEWLAFIAYIVAEVERQGFDLVVFDTISNLWYVKDENNSCEVQEALMPLRSLPSNTALVLVHHIGKADGHEGTAGRGSTAFGAFVDIILEFRRFNAIDKEDTRRTLTGLGRPRQVPREMVLRLEQDEYVNEGKKAEVQTRDLVPLLKKIMPMIPPGMSKSELQETLKVEKGSGVQNQLLTDALAAGVENGVWERVAGRPVRYYQKTPADTRNDASGHNEPQTAADIDRAIHAFREDFLD